MRQSLGESGMQWTTSQPKSSKTVMLGRQLEIDGQPHPNSRIVNMGSMSRGRESVSVGRHLSQ